MADPGTASVRSRAGVDRNGPGESGVLAGRGSRKCRGCDRVARQERRDLTRYFSRVERRWPSSQASDSDDRIVISPQAQLPPRRRSWLPSAGRLPRRPGKDQRPAPQAEFSSTGPHADQHVERSILVVDLARDVSFPGTGQSSERFKEAAPLWHEARPRVTTFLRPADRRVWNRHTGHGGKRTRLSEW